MTEFEVFGVKAIANNSYEQNSQKQYGYFNGNSKVRYNHGSQDYVSRWWLRSNYGNEHFCGVEGNGYVSYFYADNACGVVPCFTIS